MSLRRGAGGCRRQSARYRRLSHQTQARLQRDRRMKVQGRPTDGPSPWTEAKISGSPGTVVARVRGMGLAAARVLRQAQHERVFCLTAQTTSAQSELVDGHVPPSPQPRQRRRQPLRLGRMRRVIGARLVDRLGLGLLDEGRGSTAAPSSDLASFCEAASAFSSRAFSAAMSITPSRGMLAPKPSRSIRMAPLFAR